MPERWDAVVVGAGPNGLAAAITLSQAGRSVLVLEASDTVGGGLRSDEIAPGLVRDRCAAVLPFAVGSPFLSNLPLDEHGVTWVHPKIPFTHPLDDRRVGAVHRDLEQTTNSLGVDGNAYRRLVGPLSQRWFTLAEEVMAPPAHVPRHPLILARFARSGRSSAKRLSKFFATDEARGVFAGVAAHSVLPLTKSFTGAFALLFCASAHAEGWPVVQGGSQRLAEAMASLASSLGASVQTGTRVRSMADLPEHRVALFDTDPRQLESIAGDLLPGRYRHTLNQFTFGPGVFKVDHVLDGPVPWADTHSRGAGTVHAGGTFDEVMHAEAEVASGRHPSRPFVLVAQQSVVDPSRTSDHRHVLWSYCHVPNGSDRDMTEAVEAQIERFAPGFRDLIVDRTVSTTADLEAYNPNYVGGDIGGGSLHFRQLISRPTMRSPYTTPNPAVMLCSASTPPGGGVHGMAGHNAARVALSGVLR